MIPVAVDRLGWVPSFSKFFQTVLDDLGQQRSCCVLLPRGLDGSGIRQSLSRRLFSDNWVCREFALATLQAQDPPNAIGDALGVVWPDRLAARTTANLAKSTGLPEVLVLHDLDQPNQARQMAWIHWLEDWARTSQARAAQGLQTPVVAMVLQSADQNDFGPFENVRLAVRRWWGIPSAVEVRLLCRSWSDEEPRSARASWREHVLPSLVGNDVETASFLWEVITEPIERLTEQLISVAVTRSWTKEVLRQAIGKQDLGALALVSGGDLSSGPPAQLEKVWRLGALMWTPEYGLELHGAALAVLGDIQVLRHRVWRGQAAVLLPILDIARLAICRHLTNRFGSAWPVCWAEPLDLHELQDVLSDPSTCQWGHLAYLLGRHIYAVSDRERFHAELAVVARDVRNELAHYHPINYLTFENLWLDLRRMEL